MNDKLFPSVFVDIIKGDTVRNKVRCSERGGRYEIIELKKSEVDGILKKVSLDAALCENAASFVRDSMAGDASNSENLRDRRNELFDCIATKLTKISPELRKSFYDVVSQEFIARIAVDLENG